MDWMRGGKTSILGTRQFWRHDLELDVYEVMTDAVGLFPCHAFILEMLDVRKRSGYLACSTLIRPLEPRKFICRPVVRRKGLDPLS